MRVSALLAELSIKNAVMSMTASLGLNSNANNAESKVSFKKDLFFKKTLDKSKKICYNKNTIK